MPEATDISDSIADVYARSLIELAAQKGVADQVAEEFASLIDYMNSHDDFAAFMTAAAIDDDDRRQSLEKLFRGRMNDLLLGMLQVLNDRGRSQITPAVFDRYRFLLRELHGQIEVHVASAEPFSDQLADELRTQISAFTGKQALLIPRTDPDIIGGLVVRVGDLQIDTSVRQKIDRLRASLTRRAGKQIHEGKHLADLDTH